MKKSSTVRALLYSGDLLAVDLGTFAVKVLHLKAQARSLTVRASAQREVWAALAEAESEEEKTEIYARALRELLEARDFQSRTASISLSGNVVILRFLALPPGATFDPDKDLPAEAKALIPFEEPDPAVSALPLNDSKAAKQARAEMMLAAAQKDTVRRGMDIVRRAGLRPAVLINDVLALANVYEFFERKRAEETVVLVNAGATSTSVSVLENATPKMARIFNIAGNAFTRAVKREFAVDLEEAEKLKIMHGLAAPEGGTPDEDAVAARVARALGPAVKDLGGEIQRTIDVFLERRASDYPHIHRVVLAGGSAELKGLSERLAAETGMDVEVFRPLVNVAAKDGLGIKPLAPALAVACGLGLNNALLRQSRKPRANLVPKKTRRAAIILDVSPNFWRLIAPPLIALLTLSWYGFWAVKVHRHDAAVEQELKSAAVSRKAVELRFSKKKASVAAKHTGNPFAFLARLKVSGVFGDRRNSLVMLIGDGSVFVARGGKLFDANEEEVRGVRSEIRHNSLTLTAGDRLYSIDLPK